MKEYVVIKKYTGYYTQTIMAESLDEATAEAEANGDWDFYDEEFEVYGSEAL